MLYLSLLPLQKDDPVPPSPAHVTAEPSVPLLSMSDDQKYLIVGSDEFSSFLERSSRVMERALADSSDILFDFIVDQEEDEFQ